MRVAALESKRVELEWPLEGEFLRFCLVGGVGFLVDAGVLQLCLKLDVLGPFTGRLLSFALAVFATYELNRRFVFHGVGEGAYLRRFAGYLAVQGGGFGINLLIYVAGLTFLPVPYNKPLGSLILASACALGFNFVAARVLVFK